MNNEQLIADLEKVKQAITDAQKGLEDNNLQEAGDCAAAASLMLKPVVTKISDLFNKKD